MIAQTLLLFGPPGAGKGTQAKRLEKALSSPHVSTGDMFRDHLSKRTELGLKVEHVLHQGGLVPDSLTNEMVRERLLRPDVALGVILDGYPRSLPQARWLLQFLGNRGYGLRGIVVMEVPREELLNRLKGRAMKEGRRDDADDAVIARRIDTYTAETEACVAYFRQVKMPVHVVSGVGTPEEVEGRIQASLGIKPGPPAR